MFDAVLKVNKDKLWKHQSDALQFAIAHLNKLDTPCLIRMPTGTGKTGVIACLTRLSNQGTSLVLTPWAHLRNQMVGDIEQNFWMKVGVVPLKREVVSMLPSTANAVLKTNEPKVLVATFATLNDIRLNYCDVYANLQKIVSLIVVDEGHYEPAIEWGKSVKGLKTKTVLLTATPYRNDLKLFRITDSGKSTHHFTHKDAVAGSIIRELSFQDLVSSPDIANLSAAFVKVWKQAKKAKSLASNTPRAIICCSGAPDIRETVTHLRNAGLDAIGVHEQFETSRSPYLVSDVPDSQSTNSDIWVHQHKLTEGLDDHRFCCLALFTRIRNDRKLIQQIGRVLRRDASDKDVPAVLFAPPEYSASDEWCAYREFETQLRLLEPQHFRDVVDNLINSQPKVEYFQGRFRRRFSPADLPQSPQIIIPPSVLVRAVGKGFSLAEYIEDTVDTLNTEDAVILGPNINGPCCKSAKFALWVYASVRNSRSLQSASLYEIRLETHCVVLADGFVFITDSRGNLPVEYLEEHTATLGADQLARYLDKSFRPTHVSVDSSIPYDTVLRGADLRGHNLLSIPASLTDRVQICRSVRGSSKALGRRYVGMNNGRLRKEVTEADRRSYELNHFVSWAESVAKILKSTTAASDLFQRYMPACAPPTIPVPRTICLDLLRRDLTLTRADGIECRLTSSSCDITETARNNKNIYTCCFDLDGDTNTQESVALRIEYQPVKRRFWFTKETGTSVHVTLEGEDESKAKGLAEFLNQKQDIVLIGLDGGNIVYQARNFYKIDYSYAEAVLVNLIQRPRGAPICKTEKGTRQQIDAVRKSRIDKFPDGSLFRAIADQRSGLPFDDELLICDDMGTECADFVAANFAKRQLALIHAKAGTGGKISASAFHDLVSQAMKNLVYLTKNREAPKGVAAWWRGAKWNKTNISRLYRAPASAPVKKMLWDMFKSDIIGSSNPELFVVLVTTGCCDLTELKLAISNPRKRTPEVAQLLHLLDGLNGYSRQLGVRLVICDLPYSAP